MALRHRTLNAVLGKPSGPDCNLNCTYCFCMEKEALFPGTGTTEFTPIFEN